MSEYTLFGQTVSFDEATERFLDFQRSVWDAMDQAEKDFRGWYEKCGNIDAVIDNGQKQAEFLIAKYAIDRLFDELKQHEFYDISRATYEKECVNYSGIYAALTEVEDRYIDILDRQSEQAEYRAERKENRDRFVGGGFGLGGALEGAVTAGALNMLSGAGHGLVNAVGNLGSSIEASSNRSALYSSASTQNRLVNGLRESILAIYNAHLQFVNKLMGKKYRYSPFDSDKAGALLDSAKSVPEKSKELLVKSFTACPYNDSLLKYIFMDYEEERKNIWNISKRFGVDLSGTVEEVIKQIYSPSARMSNDARQTAKQKILNIMAEYGITTNDTLNELDRDYLSLLCNEMESADKETCRRLYDAIVAYDTSKEISIHFSLIARKRLDELDKEYLDQLCSQYGYNSEHKYILADESDCNELLAKIETYDASEKIKKPYIDMVRDCIETIWTEEDFNRFKELYVQTSMTDTDAITKNIEVVKSTGRTKGKELFISAFSNLNPLNVKLAAEYGIAKEKGGFALVTKVTKSTMYKKLTLDGKIIHPDIQVEMNNIKNTQPESKGNGLFGGLFGSKKANLSNQSNTDMIPNDTFAERRVLSIPDSILRYFVPA